jgi:hypothetical protein
MPVEIPAVDNLPQVAVAQVQLVAMELVAYPALAVLV